MIVTEDHRFGDLTSQTPKSSSGRLRDIIVPGTIYSCSCGTLYLDQKSKKSVVGANLWFHMLHLMTFIL